MFSWSPCYKMTSIKGEIGGAYAVAGASASTDYGT